MKFSIECASSWLPSLSKLKSYKLENHGFDIKYNGKYDGTIEIDSLDDIMRLHKCIGKKLIVGGYDSDDSPNKIIIYDGYIE